MAKREKQASEGEPSPDEKRVKVLHTLAENLKLWLAAERRKTGRSESFILETALRQYRHRLEQGRK